MARRTKVVVINDEKGRDHGKQFMVTEMDAEAAEWWAVRALKGLLGSDADVDLNAPLAQLAKFAFAALAKIPNDELKPLMDEMKPCIKVLLPDNKTTRDLLVGDVEEIFTWWQLRKAVFEVVTGFFFDGDK